MGRVFTTPLGFASQRITTATTTNVTTKRTYLHRIIVGTTAAGTITVQNAAAVVLAVLKASIPEGSYEFNLGDIAGLTIVTGAASDITVVYEARA